MLRAIRGAIDTAPAQIKRGESARLTKFHTALAHEFKRRGERGRECGRTHRRLDHIGQQEVVEPRPFTSVTDKAIENGARFDQGPHIARRHPYPASDMTLTLGRVS